MTDEDKIPAGLDLESMDYTEEAIAGVIAKVRAEVLPEGEQAPDPKTSKGLKLIASRGRRAASVKIWIDKRGKEETAEIVAKKKAIDKIRKFARDGLDALKDQVRTPMIEIDKAEKEAAAALEARIAEISAFGEFTGNKTALRDKLAELEELPIDGSYAPRIPDAYVAKDEAARLLREKIAGPKAAAA